MFEYTSPKTGLQIVEYSNGFCAYFNGETQWIGDGVGMFFRDDLTDVLLDTPEFYEEMRRFADDWEVLEAYFGLEAA